MLGALVRLYRRRQGLSQEALAARTGLSVRAIRKIEAGQTDRPHPATLQSLAEAFGLDGAEREQLLKGESGRDSRPASREPFFGREQELSRLRRAAAAAAEGAFRIMWIVGEAGAGKSALGRQISTILAQDGWGTAWGRVPEIAGAPPAWAWADVVDRLGGGLPVSSPDTAFGLARAAVQLLRREAEVHPFLLILDDMHRAGDETLQILRYAFTELADYPVLVAATLRAGEADPALDATWAALAGPRVDRLDLGGLGPDEVAQVLAEHTGSAPTADVVRVISTRTGGNPLFVGETARLMLSEGPTAASHVVPANVRGVLRRRVAALPDAAQTVLRAAAVVGLEVDPNLLMLSSDADPDVVLDGLEAAVRAGLLIELQSGAVRFSHVLVRDTIYQDLPRLRRIRLHRNALAALEAARSTEPSALAHHALAGAAPKTARAAAIRGAAAAREASAVQGHQQAAALLENALERLEAAEAAPDLDLLRLELLCALVSALSHAGNVVAARAARARAVVIARRLDRIDLLARAYTAYDAPALWTVRTYGQLDRELVDGMFATLAALPSTDSALRCRLLATVAVEVEADDDARSDRDSTEALAIARRAGEPELICYALNARYRYVATLEPQHWFELELIGREQLNLATAADLRAYQTQAHHILCMAQLAHNDLDAAQHHLDQAVEFATTGQLGLALGILGMFKGLRSMIAGRFDEAERVYAPVIQRLRAVGCPNVEEIEMLVAFSIEHARDQAGLQSALPLLADGAGVLHKRLGHAVTEPYTRALIAAGDLERAREVWAPEVPLARDYYWFRWTALRAEIALHLRDGVTAERAYHQLLPWAGHLPGLLHAHMTFGPVDQTLGALATELGRPQAAAHHYADALDLSERLGAPLWAARAREALAELCYDA